MKKPVLSEAELLRLLRTIFKDGYLDDAPDDLYKVVEDAILKGGLR